VIDTSLCSWVAEHSLLDACFCIESGVWYQNEIRNVRDESGVFRPDRDRRFSAVAWVPHVSRVELGIGITVLHNPYARVSLPTAVLDFPGVKQIARTDVVPGEYRFEQHRRPGPGDVDKEAVRDLV
jgi:hypothetical protein